MAEKEYIEREALLERIDGIWDCADMVFEPNDKCCRSDDCASCKWRETKNAIRKIAANIPAADVRPVVKSKWVKMKFFPDWECEKCGSVISGNTPDPWNHYHYCPNCGADMRIFSTNYKNTVTTGEDREISNLR